MPSDKQEKKSHIEEWIEEVSSTGSNQIPLSKVAFQKNQSTAQKRAPQYTAEKKEPLNDLDPSSGNQDGQVREREQEKHYLNFAQNVHHPNPEFYAPSYHHNIAAKNYQYYPKNQELYDQQYYPASYVHSNPPIYNNAKDYYQQQPIVFVESYENFYFKPRREKLNWRVLNAIDVDKLMDDIDIETLESVTKNITFSRVDCNDIRYFTEENFVQLFRISQLIIEYLLYVQNYLESRRAAIENDVQIILSDLEQSRVLLNQKNDEINFLKKELKRKKKLNYAYQVVFGTNPERLKMMLQGMKHGNIPEMNAEQEQPLQKGATSAQEVLKNLTAKRNTKKEEESLSNSG